MSRIPTITNLNTNMKRFTIQSWGRRVNCQGPTITIEAKSLLQAIRVIRKKHLTQAWQLSIKSVEEIPQDPA